MASTELRNTPARAGAGTGPTGEQGTLSVFFIPGVLTPRRRLRGWQATLAALLPHARAWVPPRCFYWLWGMRRQQRLLASIEAELRHAPGPVWLLAHSFGGLIARGLVARCPDAPVVLLTCMASPHTFPVLGIARQARALGVQARCPVPVLTYGGYLDWTVPYPWTRLEGAVHRNLRCGHLAFLFDARVRERVVGDALRVLPQPPVTTS